MRELIVELPAPHGRIAAIALRQLRDDALHILSVDGRAPVRLFASAVLHADAFCVDHQNFGMVFRQPGRRRRAGRAEDDFEAVLLRQGNHAVEPIELIAALGGLHEGPGKLADVNIFEAELLNVGDVAFPLRLRPGLRIVINPGGHELVAWEPFFGLGKTKGAERQERKREAEYHLLAYLPRPSDGGMRGRFVRMTCREPAPTTQAYPAA